MKNLPIISKAAWFRNITITVFIFLSVNVFITPCYSQAPAPCGNPKIDTAALKRAQQYMKANPNRLAAAGTMVRVYFHVFRDDDGNNAAATADQIQLEFNQLIADYAPDNICFANMGLNFINNTHINQNFDVNNSNDVALLSPYQAPYCINIFYHAKLSVGGSAYSIPSTFCSIAKSNIALARTISHEVGHCFGLLHTFEGCSATFINGLFCDVTGDMVCDTPADPYCFKGSSCFSNSNCSYTGNCKDASLIQGNWSPPFNNIMSYWGIEGCTVTTLTSGQYDRVNVFLTIDPGLLNTKSPDNDAVGPVNVSSGFYVASAINQLSTSGSFNISGTTNAGLVAKTVLLEPGFHAFPSGNGIVAIRNSSCNLSLQHPITKNSSENIAQLKNEFQDDKDFLEVYPNPTSSKVNLVFTLKENQKQVLVKVYNVNSQLVKELQLSNFKIGRQSIELNLSGFSSGIYFVNLQMNNKSLISKVVLRN